MKTLHLIRSATTAVELQTPSLLLLLLYQYYDLALPYNAPITTNSSLAYSSAAVFLPHLVLGVELDLEDLGAVHLAPCALADNLRGEHEVLKKHFTRKKRKDVESDMAATPNHHTAHHRVIVGGITGEITHAPR